MRIVIAPDKFKGSLPATEVAAALAAGLRAGLGTAELITIPVADGGDGTVDAAVAAGFERVPITATGPTGEPVTASYGRRGDLALAELATICGLERLPGGRPAPLEASSFGVGEVLRAALAAGARHLVLALGGSASTDGGAGLLQGLGASVLDGAGQPLRRGGAALGDAAQLDLTGLPAALRQAEVTLAADVGNPLTGPDGAAEVFGPQKGAIGGQIAALDAGLRHWAKLVTETTGTDWSEAPGAGAAGGVGFAALAVLGARQRSGIDMILDLLGFDAALDGADLVITGEGSLDRQSLAGKAPVGVARAAAGRGVPVIAVAGRSTLTADQARVAGITAIYPLTELEADPARCMADAAVLLEQLGRAIAHDQLAPESHMESHPGSRS
jgi:glycerate kinase